MIIWFLALQLADIQQYREKNITSNSPARDLRSQYNI